MITLTYGTLPTIEQFRAAFDAHSRNGEYEIMLNANDSRAFDGFRICTGSFEYWELWDSLSETIACYNHIDDDSDLEERRMSVVSGILQTLGFEWV